MVYIGVMHQTNINGIDLNLMPPLAALLEHRNVTRAADACGMSQPAMSRALARLRDLIGDPLLVRGSAGYVLTPRAAALRPLLQATLDGVTALLTPAAFDPATALRTIRLAGTDSHSVGLVPQVMARLAQEAPGIDLRLEAYAPGLAARIESGAVDMAFAIASAPLPPGALSMPLAEDRLALVMRRGHPAAGHDWTLADYGRWHHAGVAILGDGQSDIDAQLAAAGVRRRIALTTPHFTAALATVAATDLVTTVSERFARRFAEPFGLVVKPTPLKDADLQLTVVWSHIRDADPVLGWFRGLLAEVAGAADLWG